MTTDKLILKFYNNMTDSCLEDFCDIPSDKIEFLLDMDHNHLAQPFVKRDLKKGLKGKRTIADDYGINVGSVANIGKKINKYI